MVDECFALHPPEWVKDEWLPNPGSTNLFRKYIKQAPQIVPDNSPTYQGLYLMNYDGKHLAARFARASSEETLEAMQSALAKWRQLSSQRGDAVAAVPATQLATSLGRPVESGGVKLQIFIRDYPRNDGKTVSYTHLTLPTKRIV